MSTEICYVHIRIRYSVDKRHQFLAILGNVHWLGTWRQERAVICRYVSQDEWMVSISCPRKTAFEWKLVVIDEQMKVVRWEGRKNRSTVVRQSGVMYCTWDQADEPEILNYQHELIQISTNYYTNPGQYLHLVGSTPQLGSWEPHRGIRATLTSHRSGRWLLDVVVDRYQIVEWKWVVVDTQLNDVKWEKRSNRVLHPRETRRQIFAPWEGDEREITEADISAESDESDTWESEDVYSEVDGRISNDGAPARSFSQYFEYLNTTAHLRWAAGTVYNVIALPFRLTTGTFGLIRDTVARHITRFVPSKNKVN